jgi:hypothetical protein
MDPERPHEDSRRPIAAAEGRAAAHVPTGVAVSLYSARHSPGRHRAIVRVKAPFSSRSFVGAAPNEPFPTPPCVS